MPSTKARWASTKITMIGSIISNVPAICNVVERAPVQRGELGQWAIWTRTAVSLLGQAHLARAGDPAALATLLARSNGYVDANGAVFDVAHAFAGSVPGINEILFRQGILRSALCLDPSETLGPGQAAELDRVCAAYPWLLDDEFVAEHRDEWLA